MFGEIIQFDDHIFQMGWFNHQLVRVVHPIFHKVFCMPRGCLGFLNRQRCQLNAFSHLSRSREVEDAGQGGGFIDHNKIS